MYQSHNNHNININPSPLNLVSACQLSGPKNSLGLCYDYFRAYGITRNETKQNKTNLIDKEITIHQVGETTKIYSFSWKPVLTRCLQNTDNGQLVINETSFADNFFRRSASENYLAR